MLISGSTVAVFVHRRAELAERARNVVATMAWRRRSLRSPQRAGVRLPELAVQLRRRRERRHQGVRAVTQRQDAAARSHQHRRQLQCQLHARRDR